MIDPEIEKLLALQEIDTELIQVVRELDALPVRRHKIKVRIEEREVEIEEARQNLMSLEVRRKELENEVGRLEDQVTRYKNQQLQVKKNEEYQALTHEIDTANARIGELEEEEIAIMLEIDEENDAFRSRKDAIEKEIRRLREEVESQNAREVELEARKLELEAEVNNAREGVSRSFLQAYDQAKRNLRSRPPFVAPIENGICKRSNLRVSNDLLAEAREHGTPHFDTETGCVVFIPS